MIKFASSGGASAEVSAGSITLVVFPEKPVSGRRSLLANPIENFDKNAVCWPGEYDFDGIFLRGIGQQDGKQVSYVSEIEGVRCAFVHEPVLEWSDADIEKLGDVDVLLIAAEHEKNTKALVEAVDPRILILIENKEADVKAIAKACGAADAETVDEMKIQKSTLPTDSRKVVILK